MTTPHLDDEALSAALDAAATEAEQAHLSWCDACQAQLASLAAVARAVGAPVSPRPSHEDDDAIEQALRAWSGVAPERPVDRGGAATSRPVRLADRGGPPRWLGTAAGVAAAVLVVGAVLGGALALSRGSSPSRSSTAGLAAPSVSSTVPSPSAASAGNLLDLGNQTDPATLAQVVTAALAQRASPNTATAPAFSSGSTTVAGDQAAAPACVAEAATAVGLTTAGTPEPRFTASLRWRGEPAVVVVFSGPSGLAGVVMKQLGCSVLADLPL